MDTSRHDEPAQEEDEETPRSTPARRRRGGTPQQPVERAVTQPPERR